MPTVSLPILCLCMVSVIVCHADVRAASGANGEQADELLFGDRHQISGPTGTDLSFDALGRRLLVTGGSVARVWDADKLTPVTPPMDHGGAIVISLLSADGKVVVTGGGNEARVWDVMTSKQLLTLHHPHLASAALDPRGRNLLTAGLDSMAFVWDIQSGSQKLKLRHERPVRFAAYSRDGKSILTVTGDAESGSGCARVWDSETGRELSSRNTRDRANAFSICWRAPAALSPDGTEVATIEFSGVCVWEAHSGKSIANWETEGKAGAWGPTVALQFSPDGTKLITASEGAAAVWTIQKPLGPELSFTRAGTQFWASNALFAPDGRWVALACTDDGSGVWDLASGKQILHITGKNQAEIPVIAVSPDGKRIAVGYPSDKVTSVWAR